MNWIRAHRVINLSMAATQTWHKTAAENALTATTNIDEWISAGKWKINIISHPYVKSIISASQCNI